MERRDFIKTAVAAELALVTGFSLESCAQKDPKEFLDFDSMGNLTILFMCDSHGHLRPVYYREPSVNLAPKGMDGTPGHITGKEKLDYWDIDSGSVDAYFESNIDFEDLAKKYGKMGGYAHLSTLVKNVRAERGNDKVLFLDAGDTWQGTAVALWTKGEALVEAQNHIGVDIMTPHWEFTYGKTVLNKRIKQFKGKFLAHNVTKSIDTTRDDIDLEKMMEVDEGGNVFEPYTITERNGLKIGVLGQSFPYIPLAHPRNLDGYDGSDVSEGWSFGIQEENIRKYVNELREKHQVDLLILLSHNGLEVDKKVAQNVKGIDVLVTGHTHDPLPKPLKINNTLLVQAGSHGKFLGRLDLEIKNKKVAGFKHKLYPVISNYIPADPEMLSIIDKWHKPFDGETKGKLGEKLAVTDSILYRRDTFCGTFDSLIVQAIKEEFDSEVVFSPGFRWGTTILPGENITLKDVYDLTALSYPNVWTFDLKGETLRDILADILDNLFNPNPYEQQGGDFSRLFGVDLKIKINIPAGADIRKRIIEMKVGGKALDESRLYKISAWGGNLYNAGENLRQGYRPVYDVVADYLRKMKKVNIPQPDYVKFT